MSFDVKKKVKKYYGGKAQRIIVGSSSGCGCSPCCSEEVVDNSNNYDLETIKGFIEDIPLSDELIDVVMSNCVINLSEDKEMALSEAFRVLKKGGRLAIADIITLKEVPDEIRKDAEVWCGCFAGTVKTQEYKKLLEKVGFSKVEIQPVHIYTEAVVKEIIERKKVNTAVDTKQLDGAFAGALIKAVK